MSSQGPLTRKGWRHWAKVLGPGILFASTCIGVSHLVQSTRAGAVAGFGLTWAILAANAAKYPFFEFGSRYASATGQSLIEGYKSLGRGASWLYLMLSLGTCFFVTAAVGMVTAAFLDALMGISAFAEKPATPYVAVVLFLGTTLLLLWGKYATLDRLIKALAAVLVVSTVCAVCLTLGRPPQALPRAEWATWDWTTPAGAAFLIALMGWMPTAVDLSPWNSIWTLERTRSTGYKPSLKETLKEFNLGYLLSAILALGFLALGTLLLHRTGATLPDGSAGFAAGIVQLYADSIGAWSAPLMGAAAFSAMLGTCIAVMDGYARSLNRAFAAAMNTTPRDAHHRRALVLVAAGGLCLVLGYSGQIKLLVDIATTLSFLVAPVIAFWNLRLVTRSDFPEDAQPSGFLQTWAWAGIAFLSAFTFWFLWIKVTS